MTPNVWAITMVKDEADVIEPVLRHVAAQGVAGILITDNSSTDGTADLIYGMRDLPCELVATGDPEVGYYQSRKMTALANRAHNEFGAEWVWPFDADELWYWGAVDSLVERMERSGHLENSDVIHSRLWHHFPTAVDDALLAGVRPFKAMAYRGPLEAPIGKVIVKWRPGAVIDAGNHSVSGPGSWTPSPLVDVQVRHFPYRSEDQFVRKAINGSRAYAATDLPWSTGQHWREYGIHYERGGEEALREIYRAHFFYDLPSVAGLVYDPARCDA